MKVLYKSTGGRFTVEFEGDSQKEIFREIAQFQEIFETNTKHEPNCGGETLFNYRTNSDGDSYYEKKCTKCGMTYAYGQKKKGDVLFPNTKKGWSKWVPGQDDNEEAAPAPVPAAPFAGKNNNGAKGKGR